MDVTMDAARLAGGAAAFDRHGETLLGHARSVEELARLRAAFAGAGEQVWPAIEARLSEVVGRIQQAHQRAAQAGRLLSTAATESTAIDQRSGNAINR